MSGPVSRAYAELLTAGELKPDPEQETAATALDRVAARLGQPRGGLLKRLFGRPEEPVCGVYLWGGVGRGKSMLMDLAYEHVPAEPKRRVHFHPFMLDVHQRLRRAREGGRGDPIPLVAESIAA